ncbi:hypothetical protein B0H13DRAFT_2349839 [Mycena leptocephala]|nr:hypothetical protein B0H13DRAFT_2349839 [Mycena leptocephala]
MTTPSYAYHTPPHIYRPSHLSSGQTISSTDDGQFAIACIGGAIWLVQVSLSTPASAFESAPNLAAAGVDLKVFRHEFIHIFRYLENWVLRPVDVHIIQRVDDRHRVYEEENETVFLAREVMEQMSGLMSRGEDDGGWEGKCGSEREPGEFPECMHVMFV